MNARFLQHLAGELHGRGPVACIGVAGIHFLRQLSSQPSCRLFPEHGTVQFLALQLADIAEHEELRGHNLGPSYL